MLPIQLSRQEAKSIILRSQMLEGKRSGKGKQTTFNIINQLGYLQVDTISVVERAHHHILWTRQPSYSSDHLDSLQSHDRKVFEYWGHAAAYLPMADFRFYQYKMQRFLDRESQWFKKRIKLCKPLIPMILDRISKEGGLSSKDFKSNSNKKGTGWWDWKPSKIALELLFWQGLLMVSARKGFQKVYDLPNLVVPTGVDQTVPSLDEICDYQIKKSLTALGIASEKDIQYILKLTENDKISRHLTKLVKNDLVRPVKVGKLEQIYYALPAIIDQYNGSKLKNNKIHLLSPFDNLIINRTRLKTLFDFNYTIECYVPAPKRKYGYFCLPVLWKGNFIGRFDIKADRKQKTLLIQQMHFEEKVKLTDELTTKLSSKLLQFMDFNRCEKLTFSQNCSSKIVNKLQHSKIN